MDINGDKDIFKKEPTLRTGRCGWRTTERDGGGRRERAGWTATICERERVSIRENEREMVFVFVSL